MTPNPAWDAFLAPARAAVVHNRARFLFATIVGALLLEIAFRLGGPAIFNAAPATIWGRGPEARAATVLLASLAAVTVFWPAVALVMRWLHGQDLAALFPPTRGAFQRSAVAAGAAVLFICVVFELGFRLGDVAGFWTDDVTPARIRLSSWFEGYLAYVLAAIVLITLQASAEEVVYRGYLQQRLGALSSSPWVWAAIPSVLFGVAHYTSFGPGGPLGGLSYVASTTVFGLLAAYLTWRAGSLAPAIGLHVANNWWAFLVVDAAGDDLGVLALWRLPPPDPLPSFVFGAIFCALALWTMETRRLPFRRSLDEIAARVGDRRLAAR